MSERDERDRGDRRSSPARRRWAVGAALSLSLALAMGLVACGTLSRTVVAPPTIPGATFVGSAACADCHEEIVQGFRSATHANLQARGANALEVGCESCHGPGSLHSESGGEPGTILNPKQDPLTCYQCHLAPRAAFQLPYHHPVPEGRLSCQDCHDPHQGPAVKGAGTSLVSADAACLECHDAQRGPHVFEHEAMREGCTTCHQPHGTVNAKLLTQRNASLCLKCHIAERQTGGRVLIGGFDHSALLAQGTCWSAGCHEAVHGSQVNSSLRY